MTDTIRITVKTARMQIASKMIAGFYSEDQIDKLTPLVEKLNNMKSDDYVEVEVKMI